MTNQFPNDVLEEFARIGSNAKSFEEAVKDPLLQKYIQQGVDEANKK